MGSSSSSNRRCSYLREAVKHDFQPGYTSAAAASDAARYSSRKGDGLLPTSSTLDALLGYLSIVTGSVCVLLAALSGIPMFLSLLAAAMKGSRSGAESSNISKKEGGSCTALGCLFARSLGRQLGFGPDLLATALLRSSSLPTRSAFGFQVHARTCELLLRLNFWVTRRIWVDQLVPRFSSIGAVAYLHGRTCFLDDVISAFVSKRRSGRQLADSAATAHLAAGNVVILGAGYDTRLYRLPLGDGVRLYEVDAPGTSRAKQAALLRARIDTARVNFAACDFESESWLDALQRAGMDTSMPTCVICEGVSMYLPRAAFAETLAAVGSCGPGSVIAFDYFGAWALGDGLGRMLKAVGEPLHFCSQDDDALESLIRETGLVTLDHIRYKEAIARYLPQHADGRCVGFLANFGGFVVAGHATQHEQ